MVAQFDNFDTVGLDLETTGLSPIDSRILLCQIGFGEIEYVINVLKVSLDPLLPFLVSNKWKKLIFNEKFEAAFFLYKYGIPINNTFDCFLAEKVLRPDSLNNSFEDVAMRYLGVQLDKKVRKSFIGKKTAGFSEKQIKYAAEDVQYLFPLYEQQKAKLAEDNLTEVAELEFSVAPVVASMEITGVPVDAAKWRDKIRHYEKELADSREHMFEILFDDNNVLDEQMGLFERDALNLRSQPQLLKALQKIGLDIESTDEREISLVDHPAAKELLHYRGVQKIISAYGYSLLEKIHPFTGRLHAEFQQLGTETGRFSCKNPNLQQMPKEFRECFISGDDYDFVGADYSQIELRILAQASRDPLLMAAFNSGHDVHSATAASMFNIPLASVTPEQRFAAKTLNFGMMYGMGVNKLMDSLNTEALKTGSPTLNIRQVQSIHFKYKQAYKKATDWLERAGQRAIRQGVSETLYGRKRTYRRPASSLDRKQYERQLKGIHRQGANSPIQGTSADITKLAMVNLHNELEDFGFKGKIVLQVHDEIVVLAHKKQSEAIKSLVVESMTRSARQLLTEVPVVVDTYINEIWKK